ncbi:MAG: hypothetical protein AB8B79_05290 [Granulosicoccus sp.]
MTLLYPVALFLMLPLALAFLWLQQPLNQSGGRLPGSWHKVTSPALNEFLLQRLGNQNRQSNLLDVICAALIIMALAHPRFTADTAPPENFKARVIALDMSVGSNVLAQRFYVDTLIQGSSSSGAPDSIATGLVLVSDGAYSVVPITNDVAHLQRYLNVAAPEIMPESGHDLHEGIAVAEKMLSDAGISVGQVIVVTSQETVSELPNIPEQGRLRDLVIVDNTVEGWQLFARKYGAQIYSSEQSHKLLSRLDSKATETLYLAVQNASLDLRPLFLSLTLLIWLWFLRRRASA